jgi:hypothetical protein
MNDLDIRIRTRGGTMSIPRSRGAATGLLLILLGLWGALIPFVGPYVNFAFGTEQEWTWTAARGWLEVLPGIVTVVGGVLLTFSGNRATAMLGAWLSAVAGAWFVAGRALAAPLGLDGVGTPVAASDTKAAWLELTYFSGLGALIIFLAALCMGRLSVRSLRDIRRAESPVALVDEHSNRTAEPVRQPVSVDPSADSPTAGDDAAPRHRGLLDRLRRRDATSARR